MASMEGTTGSWMATLTGEPTPNTSQSLQTTYPSAYLNKHHSNAIASILIIIGILGMIGNCLILIAVSFSRKLQTATNAFVVSLSISDFLTATTLPFQAVGVMSEAGWPLPQWICTMTGLLFALSTETSFLTLAAIALNRYIVITKSKRLYQKVYSRQGIAIMLTFMWLFVAVTFLLPQMIPVLGATTYHPAFRLCTWVIDHHLALIIEVIAAIGFITCTLMIVICYTAIYIFLRRHFINTDTSLGQHSGQSTHDNSSQATSRPRPSVKEINITKNLATVVLVFFICYLPNLSTVAMGYTSVPYIGFLIVLPTCLNPLVYASKHPNFKEVIRCLLTCRVKDIPHPSPLLKSISNLVGGARDSRSNTSSTNVLN